METIEQAITSMEVAEMVGKEHKKLLRDIRTYIEQLNESKIGLVDFFKESTYKDAKGERRPCYNISKKGCEFIAHKLTGVKGTEFTAKYINRFHDMAAEIDNRRQQKPLTALEQLRLVNAATLEVADKVNSLENNFETFKQELPLLGVDMEKITSAAKSKVTAELGGYGSRAYKNNEVRSKVYSDVYAELRRQFGYVSSYKELKRNQTDEAVAVINAHVLPICLRERIRQLNSIQDVQCPFDD